MTSDHSSSVRASVDEALRRVNEAGRLNRFNTAGSHVRERMSERGVTMRCIARALRCATKAEFQPNSRWKISGGTDIDNDPLTVIVAIQRDVLVVTLF